MTTATVPVQPTTLVAWLAAQTWSDFAQSLARQAQRRPLSLAQVAAAERMRTKCEANAARRAAAAVVADENAPEYALANVEQAPAAAAGPVGVGIYFHDGDVYKVKVGRSGRPYAVRLTGPKSWTYAAGVIFRLTAEMKATPEQAAAYGRRTGTCCCCGAHLEDRDELGAITGVGPVCAPKYFGLTQRQLAAALA